MSKSSYVFVHKMKDREEQKSSPSSSESSSNKSLPIFQEQILKRIQGIAPLGQSTFAPNNVTQDMSASPPRPLNIVGFDWDRTLLTYHSQGYLFFLGDDNKDDHKALRPALVQLLTDVDGHNKQELLTALKSQINEFFIHTMGVEVELVDEKGDILPQLFYSGKQAIIKYLEALFGDDWRNIIPEENIHCLRPGVDNPTRKYKIAFSRYQYHELKEKIQAFRTKYLKKVDDHFELSKATESKINPKFWGNQFQEELNNLVQEIEDQPNMINFYKELKPHQQYLFGKGIHLSDALDVIVERYRNKLIEVSIENVFMVDDDIDNCYDLTALQQEFPQVKRLVTILHENNRDERKPPELKKNVNNSYDLTVLPQLSALLYGNMGDTGDPNVVQKNEEDNVFPLDPYHWSTTIPRLLSKNPEDEKFCHEGTHPSQRGKSIFTDFASEVKAGNWWIINAALNRFDATGVLESKLEEIVSEAINIATLANELGQKLLNTPKDKKDEDDDSDDEMSEAELAYLAHRNPEKAAQLRKKAEEARRQKEIEKATIKIIDPQLSKLHKTFFLLLDRIIKLIKHNSTSTKLKTCHELFSHPQIKACFSFIDQYSGSSIVEYMFGNLFFKITGDRWRTQSSDQFKTLLSEPLSMLLFLLENVKEAQRFKNPQKSEVISRIISMKIDPLETTKVVKRLVEDCNLSATYLASEQFYGFVHPLIHAIGVDPDNRNRFALCEYLIAKGVTLNSKMGSSLLNELIDANDLTAVRFFCENTKVDLTLKDAWTGPSPMRRAYDKLDFNNPNPAHFAMFQYLASKQKPEASPLLQNAKEGNLKIVKYLCELGCNAQTFYPGHDGNAFEVALANNQLEIAAYLLTQGFNVNGHTKADENPPPATERERKSHEKDGEKFTPLLIKMAMAGNLEAVMLLCENGADIDIKDIHGNTALDVLCMSREEAESFNRGLIDTPYQKLYERTRSEINALTDDEKTELILQGKFEERDTLSENQLLIKHYLQVAQRLTRPAPSADKKAEEKTTAPVENKFDEKPIVKIEKKSEKTESTSAFEPLVKFVMHLTSHNVEKSQVDEILYYARWYLKTGGSLTRLIEASNEFFAGNKNSLIAAVRELISGLKPPTPFKTFSQVKSEFEGKAVDVKITLPAAEIEELSQRFNTLENLRETISAMDYHQFHARMTEVVNACKAEFKETNKLQCSRREELLANLREAYWRTMGIYPNDVQMFNIMALINDPQGNRLAQIKTGEGKSTIMAMLSSYYALLGLKPDVITTHDNLAERDVEKLTPFYSAIGLKASYVKEGGKLDATADILYGTFSAYEGLWLGSETRRGSSRGNRPYDICLVDEADNLFIDNKQTSLRYLFGGENNDRIIRLYKEINKNLQDQPQTTSNPFMLIMEVAKKNGISLGHIQVDVDAKGDAEKTTAEEEYIYQTWKRGGSLKNIKDPRRLAFYKAIFKFFDRQVDFILETNKRLNDKNKIPGFVDEQEIKLDRVAAKKMFNEWIDAKYIYKLGVDYHILYDTSNPIRKKPKEIEFIDWKNTGQLQGNMRYWTMHTFLEIMHKVPPKMMESIVCRTNHLSYMKRYQFGCKCVTGTAGTDRDRQELGITCGINTYDSPSYRPNIKEEKDPVIVEEAKYQATLTNEVKQRREAGQPVVIFVESINETEELTELFRKEFGQDNVQYYNAVQKDIPENIIKQAAAPGMVTIVTNIGGRGMDITTTDENPLHLIFTNLFANKRVEAQAIGRTGRQGRKGTYNYVLNAEKVCDALSITPDAENIDHICKNPQSTIAGWYEEQEAHAVSEFSSQLAAMKLDYLVEKLQHVFMMLNDSVIEANLYRWAEYISAMDHLYNKKSSNKSSLDKVILSEFINLWNSCHLSYSSLWDILNKPENAEIAAVFNSHGYTSSSETVSPLRTLSLFEPADAKSDVPVKRTINLARSETEMAASLRAVDLLIAAGDVTPARVKAPEALVSEEAAEVAQAKAGAYRKKGRG